MKKSLFLFFVTTAFLISCTKEPHQNFTKINDLDLVEVFQSKSNLLNLSPRNRKIAWIARLNEYKNLDLKPSQVILIDELIKEIESMDTEVFMATPKLTELAIEMAKITPMEDYLNLFCSTGDYLPEITGIGSVCEQCILFLPFIIIFGGDDTRITVMLNRTQLEYTYSPLIDLYILY